jgi:hypothetical protein
LFSVLYFFSRVVLPQEKNRKKKRNGASIKV